MARDSYYQPVDNPLRYERLPRRRPKMALPVRTGPKARLASYRRLAVYYHAILLAVIAIFWLEPPLGGLGVIGVSVLYFGRKALEERDWRWLTLTWPFPVAALVTIVAASPMLDLSVLVVLGWISWLFGRHWIAYCTASPHPRARGETLRRDWAKQVAAFSIIVPTAGLAAAVVGQPVIFFLVISSAVATQLVLTIWQRDGWFAFSVAKRALACWLTYDATESRTPGLLSSPAGPWRFRIALTAACLLLVSIALPYRLPMFLLNPEALNVRPGLFAAFLAFAPILAMCLLLPLLATLILPIAMNLAIFNDAARRIPRGISGRAWKDLTKDIRRSADPIERRSIYRGRNAADGSPVLVHRKVFSEHAHFLGDAGGGKTSLGLMPTIEQLLADGNCSVIVVDLKADSLELMATLEAAAAATRTRTGITIPVKHFTNQTGLATYSLNPLMQPYWQDLELYMRTDILCGALGLTYGPDYGQGYYGSANAAGLHYTLKSYPEASTFRQLADAMGYLIAGAKQQDLHPEIKKAGVHVQEVIKRLASFDALNVACPTGDSPYAIDLAEVFTKPQAIYFHLSSSLAPGSSPEIARLVVYLLLCAASRVERRHPVYLVVDEFQRMVASNVEYMLQLARSMGVGIILANQSLQDLKTSTADLIPAVEANCRYREWFSISSSADRKNLIETSGETIEIFRSFTRTTGERGSTSVTRQERLVPRLTMNDVLAASDDPMKSIVKITRGEGYAQYGGMPFIVKHDYHITADEYAERKAFPWPEQEVGMLVAGSANPDDGPPPGASSGVTSPPSSPSTVTTEIVGDGPAASPNDLSELFPPFEDDDDPDATCVPA